jgi:hypothetical protein
LTSEETVALSVSTCVTLASTFTVSAAEPTGSWKSATGAAPTVRMMFFFDQGSETHLTGLNVVIANGEIGEAVAALIVALGRARYTRTIVFRSDGRARNDGARRINDGSRDGGCGGLSPQASRSQANE